MRLAAGALSVLATGRAILVDLVTLTIPRSWYLADGTLVSAPAVARWTSHDRALRYGGNTFRGLSGTVWTRGKRTDTTGQELAQFEGRVAGPLAVAWRTSPTDARVVEQIELSDLAALGLLEGATLRLDEAVLTSWPGPDDEIAAGSVLEKRVLVEIQSASRDGFSVVLTGRSPLAGAGDSVPRSVVSPFCRWEFGSVECMGAAVPRPLDVVTLTDAGDGTVSCATGSITLPDWRVAVPLSGRNMGVARMIGAQQTVGALDVFRVDEAWPWPLGTADVAILRQCSRDWAGGDSHCAVFGNRPRYGGFVGVPASESV